MADLNFYENISKDNYHIYNNIEELFKLNPNIINEDNIVLFLINYNTSGFGSQITVFVQNSLYATNFNKNIICLPYFCNNGHQFKYCEENVINSFFLYFKYKKEININSKIFFCNVEYINNNKFIEWCLPLNLHEPNIEFIEYMKNNFELKIGENIHKYINTIKLSKKKLIGIHIRSLYNRIVHAKDYNLHPIPIKDSLNDLKNKLNNKYGTNYDLFIATDVSFYIDWTKEIFSNINIYYNKNIDRIDTELDSMNTINVKPGFKLGSDFLYDCIGLFLCDEIYLHGCNILFMIEMINYNNEQKHIEFY